MTGQGAPGTDRGSLWGPIQGAHTGGPDGDRQRLIEGAHTGALMGTDEDIWGIPRVITLPGYRETRPATALHCTALHYGVV